MAVLIEPLVGLVLGIALGWAGYRLRLITRGAALAVAVVVAGTFWAAGWTWGVLWAIYFGGAWLFRRLGIYYKAELLQRSVETLRRGPYAVAGVAGWSLMLALVERFSPGLLSVRAAFVGAVAVATADLCATELGMLGGRPPRLINSGRPVPHGTAGAVSLLGTVAAFGGAWLQGFAALFSVVLGAWVRNAPWDRALLALPLAAACGGLAGALVDSLLGAAAQAMYYCEHCGQRSDRPVHHCGRHAEPVRGWSWLTNEGVDLVGTIVGAAMTAGLVEWLAQTFAWW